MLKKKQNNKKKKNATSMAKNLLVAGQPVRLFWYTKDKIRFLGENRKKLWQLLLLTNKLWE